MWGNKNTHKRNKKKETKERKQKKKYKNRSKINNKKIKNDGMQKKQQYVVRKREEMNTNQKKYVHKSYRKGDAKKEKIINR